MKDTTLESLEGRHNRSITPPPDIVKKRQQQAANQAANQRAHHKPSSNIEHVRYNEDERKQRQPQFSSRPQESDRQPSGEYRVRSESREQSPRGQRSRYLTKILEDGIGTRRGMTQDQAMRNIHIHIHIHIDLTGRQVRNQEDHETVVETMISEGPDMYKVIVHEDPQVLKTIVERLGESLGTRIGRTQGQGMSNMHMHIHLTGCEVMTLEYHETVTEKMNHESQEMYTVSVPAATTTDSVIKTSYGNVEPVMKIQVVLDMTIEKDMKKWTVQFPDAEI